MQAVFGRCRWWSSPSVFDMMSVLCAEKVDEFLAYFGLLRLTFGLLRLTSAYFGLLRLNPNNLRVGYT